MLFNSYMFVVFPLVNYITCRYEMRLENVRWKAALLYVAYVVFGLLFQYLIGLCVPDQIGVLFLELADDAIFFICGKYKSGIVATLSDLGIPVVLLVLVFFGVIDVKLTMVGFCLIVLNYVAMFHVSQTWDDSEFTFLNVALKSLCYFPYPAQTYL